MSIDAPNIIQSQGDAPDPLRARDVAFALQGVDCDPKLKALIIQLADRCFAVTKGVAELVTMFDQMIDTMQGVTVVAENMKRRTDAMMQVADDQEQCRMNPVKIEKVSLRLTTKDDMHIDAYDNTRLVAINTCPTWGITRYGMHKTMSAPGNRVMPLEMGSAAHEVFAAVRLWQLRHYQKQTELADFHGPRLFGETRYAAMLEAVNSNEDDRQQSLQFCLTALETFGFYDDPSDKRRTMTNLEEACIAYIDRWDWNRMPVWIRDELNSQSDVGIELPFDVVLSFLLQDDRQLEYRFIGKADGLHQRGGKLYLHENKTASRLDDAWRQSFLLSSQITGYCLSLSVWAGAPIEQAEIYGMCVPLPKSYDYGGITRDTVPRYSHHFARWFDWFLHTVTIDQQYKGDPMNAPRYTHSCNRYFRTCSMLPFCDADEDEQRTILGEMYIDEWSPLHEVNTSGD